MKKTTIAISFDEEKLKALNRFTKKKNIDYKKELEDYAERLYLKHVPVAVRDYIEDLENDDSSETTRTNRKGNEK